MIVPLAAVALAASSAVGVIQEAERLAADAMAHSAAPASLAEARRALQMTGDFEPTVFVRAGRKGEVVEDAFVAARQDYRRHRSGLYQAVGACLLSQGQPVAATRYFERARLLDPESKALALLARAYVASGKGRPALDVLGSPGFQPSPEDLSAAADAAGVASAQAEMDRARILALKGPEWHDGPLGEMPGARLSTGGPLALEDPSGVTVLYEAGNSCRSCTEDLQHLRRAAALPGVRIVLVPERPNDDQSLREVLAIYHYPWPILHRERGIPMGLQPGLALVVARGAWAGVLLHPPFDAIEAVVKVFSLRDVKETVPRSTWNHRPADRTPRPPPPGLLGEGLAPGEEDPAPPQFVNAVEAFRAGRYAEALKGFEALEAKGDGWLLPPEARLDRAMCLAPLGMGEQARILLLKTGDSRFQEAVDRTLERVGSAKHGS